MESTFLPQPNTGRQQNRPLASNQEIHHLKYRVVWQHELTTSQPQVKKKKKKNSLTLVNPPIIPNKRPSHPGFTPNSSNKRLQ